MTTHIMCDIETLGTRPGAIVALSAPRVEPVAWQWRTRSEDNWTFSNTRLSLNDIGRTSATFEERALYAVLPSQPALDPATVERCAKEAEVWQGLKGPKLADKIRVLLASPVQS